MSRSITKTSTFPTTRMTTMTTTTTTTMTTTKRMFGALAMLAAIAFGATGCADEYDHTDVTGVVPAKLTSDINTRELKVPEGMIIKAHIVVWNDDNEPMPLEIRSSDTSIVEIASVISDRDYAFIGKKAGHTQVQFVADGNVVVTLEADVTTQPDLAKF